VSTTGTLPVADAPTTRAAARDLLRRHRGPLRAVLVLHGLGALAGLAGPVLLGRLVDAVLSGTTTATVDVLVGLLVAALVAQTALTWLAKRSSFVLAETVFADLREDFLATVTRLPLSTVERAGTGDLVSRTTNDIDAVSYSVRYAVPRILVASVTTVLTLVALVVSGPALAPAVLVSAPLLWFGCRWYLARARDGYLREIAAYAALEGTVTETVDGARTVSALRLGPVRRRRSEERLAAIRDAERYTLRLRMVWYPVTELAYVLPVVSVLAWGGWLVAQGSSTVGQVTTVTLLVYQLIEPLDELLSWLDELQIGGASLARIVGVGLVPDDPSGPRTARSAPATCGTPTGRVTTSCTGST